MKTERRPANEAQVGREWVDLAVYQQKVKELQSTIRQRLHEQVDPQQFGRIVNEARSQYETSVDHDHPTALETDHGYTTPSGNDYCSSSEPSEDGYIEEELPENPSSHHEAPRPQNTAASASGSDAGEINEYHSMMVRNLSVCLEQLYSSCHMTASQAEERRAMKRITNEPSAENVMQLQKEIAYLNSRIPILLLINARDHLLLLSRQLQNDSSAAGLKNQLNEELHNVGSRLHQALVSWESANAEGFQVNGVRVLDVLLNKPASANPPQAQQPRAAPVASPQHLPAMSEPQEAAWNGSEQWTGAGYAQKTHSRAPPIPSFRGGGRSPTSQQAAPQASPSRPQSAASTARVSSSRPQSAASTARSNRSVTFEDSPVKDRTRSAPSTANKTARGVKIAWNKAKGGTGTPAAADTWSGSSYGRSKGAVSVTKESRRATSISAYSRAAQQSKTARPANNRPKTAGPQTTNRQPPKQNRNPSAVQNRHTAPQAQQARYTTPPHSRNVVSASRYTTPPQTKSSAQPSSARRATSYSAFSTPQTQRPQSQRGTGGRRPPASPQDATAASYMSPREIEARIQETLSRYGL